MVVSFNGKEVQSVSQLRNLVARMAVGKEADLKILREGKGKSSR
ncbi:MAG: PDZ domain-containing protein [Nitrospira sp.]|nr:PDZ domain-containing protein [Nitrospira sp.]